MIKAKELVWGRYPWVHGEYEYAKISKIASFIVTDSKAELHLEDNGKDIAIWGIEGLPSTIAAKLACQDKYNDMVKNMADIVGIVDIVDRLQVETIKNAVEYGFTEGRLFVYEDEYTGIKYDLSEEIEKAQKEFLKKLEAE